MSCWMQPTVRPRNCVDPAHPLGVAAGEVVVHGDDVDAAAREGVQRDGERRDERLALAGPHLGDLPLVEDHAAHELDVVVALPDARACRPRGRARRPRRARRRGPRGPARAAPRASRGGPSGRPGRGRGSRPSRARSASSERALISGSSALIAATRGCSALTSRSCFVPKTLESALSMIMKALRARGARDADVSRRDASSSTEGAGERDGRVPPRGRRQNAFRT